eukprot:TRINITY_DN2152_c0_g1_i1.p1 TRINITY_DN2152_c0_g1~~TRINITY_DN2152_c0_g1_i1.p1  ORF type:complete len:490 (-),score=136.14 TRINITY_DN2152_c0_g1_i1:16-1452(-)
MGLDRVEDRNSINLSTPGSYPPRSQQNRLSYLLWLFFLTFSLAGVQFTYSIQFAVGLPLFGEKLKIQTSIVTIILATAGPISGFLVQPVIGVLSDRCTSRLGRRRPFILAGTIICAVGMAIIGNSADLGNLCGDHADSPYASDHKFGIVFAITGLWIMNVCVNVVQGPARAIVADLVADEEQQTGNAMVSLVMGMSAIIANCIGAQFLTRENPYRILFIIGICFILASIVPTMIAAKEERYIPRDGRKTSIISVFRSIGTGFAKMPGPLVRVLIVFFFSWAGYSPFMIYITTFFAERIYGGNTNTDQHALDVYHDGVKVGMYALAIFAGVQMVFSLMMPAIIRKVGFKWVYFLSQILAAGCFIGLFWIHDAQLVYVAATLTALVAINFTAFNSIPFGLVTSTADKEDAGLYMGVLNSASVVAQTVTNIIAGQIVGWQHQNTVWGIAFGGIIAFLGSMLVWTMPTPKAQISEDEAPLLK